MGEDGFGDNRIFHRIRIIQERLQNEMKKINERIGSSTMKLKEIVEIVKIAYDMDPQEPEEQWRFHKGKGSQRACLMRRCIIAIF